MICAAFGKEATKRGGETRQERVGGDLSDLAPSAIWVAMPDCGKEMQLTNAVFVQSDAREEVSEIGYIGFHVLHVLRCHPHVN